ncbi:terminase large subunit [Desulfuromonas thiophila]|uniref:Phage terminase-like protein, large subunit, contains N-terminal HTH domain n=1 Tax=Desulfuromonas thiophila TaxID=57664 RepID=A0A1G7B2N0_9BACT|nr:terminase TerL endonuclease subunit [Desulfuromonas thiophila]SDE21097.1 Phage terminase-like protein, large subunit, contains N-terminal HTH domain [Desulfuromonas thiophila]
MAKEKHPHVNKANRHARDVVAGKVPACLYVVQACKRHLDDLKREKTAAFPYRWDAAAAQRVCGFAELMPHVKGKWAGGPITLEPWQCFALCVLFGWLKKGDGKRRFREIYWEIPRKNAKSSLGAVIGNYMFSADGEPGAEVYSGATSLDQAMEVFRPAWLMAKKLPGYRQRFGVELGGTDKNPGNIYSMATGSRFEAVIGKPGDGASVHCGIVDEYHEHQNDHMYDCFATGMGSREQPLLAVITTAGTNTASPCFHRRKQAIKVLSGEVVDDQLFALIYTVDADDDWTDFEVWKKANPNYGVSVFEDYLRRQHQTAIRDARKQNILKCKHLNIWSNAGEAFFNMVEFEKCADSTLDINDFFGEPAYVGLDLAAKKDLAALMILFRKGPDYFLFSRYYLPEEETRGEDKAHYAGWAHDGYIMTTPGNRIDYSHIEDDIKQLARDHDLSGADNGGGEVCNDPWNAQQLVSGLENEGIAVTEISQTVNMLSEPMKELDAIISAGNLHHDGNPVTYWCFANTMARKDKKDNVFPFKEGDENKIDGAVATINAMCRAMVEDGGEISMPMGV